MKNLKMNIMPLLALGLVVLGVVFSLNVSEAQTSPISFCHLPSADELKGKLYENANINQWENGHDKHDADFRVYNLEDKARCLILIGENTVPVISLVGSNPVVLQVGVSYVDGGATAADTEDGNITSNIVVSGDTVNTNAPGTYIIKYNVTDSDGATAQEVTRTVIVEEKPPEDTATLTIIKTVINDSGAGTATSSDFTINVTGATTTSFAGSQSGTNLVLKSFGSYEVTEGDHEGYTVSYSSDCSGTLAANDNKVCTITNNDIPEGDKYGILQVIKNVLGVDGVTDIVDSTPFVVQILGNEITATSTISENVNANFDLLIGMYSVSEFNTNGYELVSINGQATSSVEVDVVAGTTTVVNVVNKLKDTDEDGDPDLDDNCPIDPNPDQADNDRDGFGNVCDETLNPVTTTGVLVIMKDVQGVSTSTAFYVTVNGATSTISESESVLFANTATGTYSIAEVNIPSGFELVSINEQATSSLNVEVVAGATTTVTIINKIITGEPILGCTDQSANNYNPLATQNDQSCDYDEDNDEVLDVDDNCPTTPNPDQADKDDDEIGDACDEDDEIITPPTDNNGGSRGGRSGSRKRSSSSRGEVLGAATDNLAAADFEFCEARITDFMKIGLPNNPEQVTKLQNFLNTQGYIVPVTGFFGPLTDKVVRAFQLKYRTEVLKPWEEINMGDENTSTGYVYKTTLWKINSLLCGNSDAFPILP